MRHVEENLVADVEQVMQRDVMPSVIRGTVASRWEGRALVEARARRSGQGRSLGRLILVPGTDPAPVVLAAFHHAGEGGFIGSCVPGSSPALRPLLEAVARITDRDTFLASHAGLFDPTRRISDGGIL